jgi:cytochrome c553
MSAKLSRISNAILVSMIVSGTALLAGCNSSSNDIAMTPPAPVNPQITLGENTFRYETFGNQGFWTQAVQLTQGLAAAGVTPLTALALGLNVNAAALSPDTAKALLDALAKIKAGADPKTTALNDPNVTLALINEGAVIGVVPFDANGNRKPLGSDANFNPSDTLNLSRGDSVGVSCAICHARTDNSIVPSGFAKLPGSVGLEVDGPADNGLDFGNIVAAAGNPRAYLPMYQLAFQALGGATVANQAGFSGIKDDTNAEVRTYLTGSNAQGMRYYPVGGFDAFPDGINNVAEIPPFYRTDLAAPWGHSGFDTDLNDFNNIVYVLGLDPTILATAPGKQILEGLAGGVGDEIYNRYVAVLTDSGLAGKYPYVKSEATGKGFLGYQVDQAKLDALTAYTNQLQSPRAPTNLDASMVSRGEQVFNQNCTTCHTASVSTPVSADVVPFAQLYPAFTPTILAKRSAPLSDIIISTDTGADASYYNELSIFNASVRAANVGFAIPLLAGLNGQTKFLHDLSITGTSTTNALSNLLDPARGVSAQHPFYITDANDRLAVTEYLRSRETK